MNEDLTNLDSFGWEALKKALNQRVVLNSIRLMPSKKNRVWVAETDVRPVVVKRFLTGKCGVEFESLLISRENGIPVPFPLWKAEDHIVMEYISGENCESLVNNMFSAYAAQGIGEWLASYHGLGGGQRPRIMGDAVLSNFIMSDGRVFGVDLEDSVFGDPLDDLGQILASILSSEPFFTPIKFDLCLRLVKGYDRSASTDSRERVRPYVSKYLRSGAKSKPLFRRTFVAAAKSLEKGWPELA
jgi:tRNA A-37 threonylcarbamoyl transferase component Bud32